MKPVAAIPASFFVENRLLITGHTDWQVGMLQAHFWPLARWLEDALPDAGTLRVYGTETVDLGVRNLQRSEPDHSIVCWQFEQVI